MSVYPAPLLFVALLCSQALAERDGAIEIQSTHMTRQSILSKDPEVPPVNPYDKDVDPTMAGLDVVKAAQEALVASGTGLFATSSVFDKHLSDYGASLKTATDKLKGLMGKMVTTVQTEREALLAKEQLRLAGIADVTNSLYTRAVDYKLEPRDEQVPDTLHQDAHLSNWLENDRIDMTREKAAAAAAASDVTHVFNQDIAPGTVVPVQPSNPASTPVVPQTNNVVDTPSVATTDVSAAVPVKCIKDCSGGTCGTCGGCIRYEGVKDKENCNQNGDFAQCVKAGRDHKNSWCGDEPAACELPDLPVETGFGWSGDGCVEGNGVAHGKTCTITKPDGPGMYECKDPGLCSESQFANQVGAGCLQRCYFMQTGNDGTGSWIGNEGLSDCNVGNANKDHCEKCLKNEGLEPSQKEHCQKFSTASGCKGTNMDFDDGMDMASKYA